MPKKTKKPNQKPKPANKPCRSIGSHSFLHSLAVVVYIILVACLMQHAEKWFGSMDNVLGPIAFLMLFTVSAAIVGLLIFGRPVFLFLNNQKKEALSFMFHTIGFLLVEAIIIFVILLGINSL
ncbi:MAG: hypothetical protein WCT08_05265 [Patescibacteria group bacterium]|jgi:hypothetical protein